MTWLDRKIHWGYRKHVCADQYHYDDFPVVVLTHPIKWLPEASNHLTFNILTVTPAVNCTPQRGKTLDVKQRISFRQELCLCSSLCTVFINWHQHNTLLLLELPVCSHPFTVQRTGCLSVLMIVCFLAPFWLHGFVLLIQMTFSFYCRDVKNVPFIY